MKNNNLCRLYSKQYCSNNTKIILEQNDYNYLINVLRKKIDDHLKIFNDVDGEWLAKITLVSKKYLEITVLEQLRMPNLETDIWLVFAPLRNNRTNNVIEKATELGVSKLIPVHTKRTVLTSINQDKLWLVVKEAAEQCERNSVPQITPLITLEKLLSSWPEDRVLLFANERNKNDNFAFELQNLEPRNNYSILIGPEGGFDHNEIAILNSKPYVKGFGLGPNILRADTAAIVALACFHNNYRKV